MAKRRKKNLVENLVRDRKIYMQMTDESDPSIPDKTGFNQ
jgi:hypothetical protein